MSIKNVFNLDEVRITRKSNLACDTAKFVMQAVANNKERHERLQEFMLFCDSVTIAVEMPVLLDRDDIQHYKAMLNFKVPIDLKDGNDVITGHIDLIQLRNGLIHIIDYKPSASKVKPIEQLTIYALALSRLTSLRLYNFKCAWFDEDDYYEFYPLHVVMKKKKRERQKICLCDKHKNCIIKEISQYITYNLQLITHNSRRCKAPVSLREINRQAGKI